jgi:CDP-diacylglycerol--glycerol-3-phosphate 3-phosphatidyltransferase
VAYAAARPAAAGWCVLLGGLADILDGRIARARGSRRRAASSSTRCSTASPRRSRSPGSASSSGPRPLAAAATALALGASMLVSYARAKGDALGVACRGGVMQRAERLVLLAVASLVDAPASAAAGWAEGTVLAGAVALIALGAMGTAVYRTAYVARALRARER